MPRDPRAAFLEAARAGADRFAPRGLEYLFAVIARLSNKGPRPAEGSGASAHASPAELCRTFRDRASADFGALAPHVLARWGLAAGSDLGGAVRLLAGQGCLRVGEGESWEEYDAAGTFRFP